MSTKVLRLRDERLGSMISFAPAHEEPGVRTWTFSTVAQLQERLDDFLRTGKRVKLLVQRDGAVHDFEILAENRSAIIDLAMQIADNNPTRITVELEQRKTSGNKEKPLKSTRLRFFVNKAPENFSCLGELYEFLKAKFERVEWNMLSEYISGLPYVLSEQNVKILGELCFAGEYPFVSEDAREKLINCGREDSIPTNSQEISRRRKARKEFMAMIGISLEQVDKLEMIEDRLINPKLGRTFVYMSYLNGLENPPSQNIVKGVLLPLSKMDNGEIVDRKLKKILGQLQ